MSMVLKTLKGGGDNSMVWLCSLAWEMRWTDPGIRLSQFLPCYTPLQAHVDVSPNMSLSVGNVVCWQMMFGMVICKVGITFIPVKVELSLCCTAA